MTLMSYTCIYTVCKCVCVQLFNSPSMVISCLVPSAHNMGSGCKVHLIRIINKWINECTQTFTKTQTCKGHRLIFTKSYDGAVLFRVCLTYYTINDLHSVSIPLLLTIEFHRVTSLFWHLFGISIAWHFKICTFYMGKFKPYNIISNELLMIGINTAVE